ncbi:tryptophan synthase subunit alpha [Arenimonas sp.]|uniref:tryptophan synthase subunit alpha n=1 Tax=Arenimonas sp. TaxID=1872635 RepID=UPI0039E2E702
MDRIAASFARLQATRRKALVPFFTAGDPSLDATVPLMHALVEAGADIIELGVPFSDPMADGPTIQRSSERALERGANTAYVFDCVRDFRQRDPRTPVVLMGYLNPVEMRGYAAYARQAVAAGVDGVLLVDLPAEESGDARSAFDQEGLKLIALASPTTTAARMAVLARQAGGYVYYVSYAGVTGADRIDGDDVAGRTAELRALSRVPVVVGFGIKDAASASAMGKLADGIVIGSALVQAISTAVDAEDAQDRARAFLRPLRTALDASSTVA